jgi:hypothetical protein
MQKTPWIICGDGSNPDFPFGFACLHCGAKEKIPTPIPFEAFLSWSKSFLRRHTGCKKKEAPCPAE